MLETALAGKNHGHAMFVTSIDHFLITNRTAGLDNSGNPS
jgi:hypothetical protein